MDPWNVTTTLLTSNKRRYCAVNNDRQYARIHDITGNGGCENTTEIGKGRGRGRRVREGIEERGRETSCCDICCGDDGGSGEAVVRSKQFRCRKDDGEVMVWRVDGELSWRWAGCVMMVVWGSECDVTWSDGDDWWEWGLWILWCWSGLVNLAVTY